MPTFAFSGRTRGGELISGERLGDTVESVTAALRREQIMVSRIGAVAAKAAAPPKKARAKTVNPKNLVMCIGAGVVIGTGDLSTGENLVAVLVFTVLSGVSVAAPSSGSPSRVTG